MANQKKDVREKIAKALGLEKGTPGLKKDSPAGQHYYLKNTTVVDYETEEVETHWVNFEDKIDAIQPLLEAERKEAVEEFMDLVSTVSFGEEYMKIHKIYKALIKKKSK